MPYLHHKCLVTTVANLTFDENSPASNVLIMKNLKHTFLYFIMFKDV